MLLLAVSLTSNGVLGTDSTGVFGAAVTCGLGAAGDVVLGGVVQYPVMPAMMSSTIPDVMPATSWFSETNFHASFTR